MSAKCFWLLPFYLLLQNYSFAQSLGVHGAVFPIAEISFLDFISLRINELEKNGTLANIHKTMAQETANKANRPSPLNLPRASITSSRLYAPETILSQNIYDASGKILYPQGTKVNAFDYLPTYQPCWLFFDGDDKSQVAWALKTLVSCKNPKIILTGGAIKEAENRFSSAIYFDQAGKMTQQLDIKSLPALVERQNNSLLIKEFCLREDGNVC